MKKRYAISITAKHEFDIITQYARSNGTIDDYIPTWDSIEDYTNPRDGMCIYMVDGKYEGFDVMKDIYTDNSYITYHVSAGDYMNRFCLHTDPGIGQYWLDSTNEIWYICGKGSNDNLILEYEQKTEYDHKYFSYLEQDGSIDLIKQVDGYEDIPEPKVFTGSSLVDDYDNLLGEDNETE
jgi:hypothetical protein